MTLIYTSILGFVFWAHADIIDVPPVENALRVRARPDVWANPGRLDCRSHHTPLSLVPIRSLFARELTPAQHYYSQRARHVAECAFML